MKLLENEEERKKQMDISNYILEILKLIFSWPPMILASVIILLITFKAPISNLIQRITKGTFPGFSIEASATIAQQKEISAPDSQLSSQEDRIRQYIRDNPDAVAREFLEIFNKYTYERLYNVIYGSQLALLEHLEKQGEKGDLYINLNIYYYQFIEKSGLSNVQISEYLGFLVNMKTIEYVSSCNESRVRITPYGLNFIIYIKSIYSPFYKGKPF
ncbi:MAG: hypothetical protein JW870_03200 [Candidatus Delongbacteria bacterium]|nr:hypothetical protein [Candidatus Delongbacteria bacterium]